jgi:hypothetical protein
MVVSGKEEGKKSVAYPFFLLCRSRMKGQGDDGLEERE